MLIYFAGHYRYIAQRGTVSTLLCQSNDGTAAPVLNALERCTSDSQEHDTVYVVTLENIVQYHNENSRWKEGRYAFPLKKNCSLTNAFVLGNGMVRLFFLKGIWIGGGGDKNVFKAASMYSLNKLTEQIFKLLLPDMCSSCYQWHLSERIEEVGLFEAASDNRGRESLLFCLWSWKICSLRKMIFFH